MIYCHLLDISLVESCDALLCNNCDIPCLDEASCTLSSLWYEVLILNNYPCSHLPKRNLSLDWIFLVAKVCAARKCIPAAAFQATTFFLIPKVTPIMTTFVVTHRVAKVALRRNFVAMQVCSQSPHFCEGVAIFFANDPSMLVSKNSNFHWTLNYFVKFWKVRASFHYLKLFAMKL